MIRTLRRLLRLHTPTPLGQAVQDALDGSPEALRAAMQRWDVEDAEAGVWRFHEAGVRARERVRRGEMARGVGGRFVRRGEAR